MELVWLQIELTMRRQWAEWNLERAKAQRIREERRRQRAANAAAIAHQRAIHDALAESKGVSSWH
jgi:hypothetical protein